MTVVGAFLVALFVGLVVGMTFSALDFPVPAPPTLAGVFGVIGTVFGMYLGTKIAIILL